MVWVWVLIMKYICSQTGEEEKRQNWHFGFYNCASYLIEQKLHEGFAPCLKPKFLIHHLNRMLAPERCGGGMGVGKGKKIADIGHCRQLLSGGFLEYSTVFYMIRTHFCGSYEGSRPQ